MATVSAVRDLSSYWRGPASGPKDLSEFILPLASGSVETFVESLQIRRYPSEAERTTAFFASFLGILRQGVRVLEIEQVQNYLLRFPDIIDVIPYVVREARRFLPEAKLVLTVFRDPESNDEYLVLYARFPRYDISTMKRIQAARRAYRQFVINKSGWIILTTDFQHPEQ